MMKTPGVNLIRGKDKSFLDKFIDWALSAGRIVIILTELVALGVFASRFYYDSKLADLHDSIKQKQQVVQFLKSDETQDRNLQNRLKVAHQLSPQGSQAIQILQTIISLAPSGIVINSIIINNGKIEIDATAFSIPSLSQFTDALKSNQSVASVSVDRIETNTGNGTISTSISIVLSQQTLL